ncbi:MAG TPA: hypothetical protein DD739_04215 [Ochrobactrum anthropi]|nr:hypothetical protein [Brucella anthropi]
MIFSLWRSANGALLRFRCSRTFSTLRSGSQTPPFSARHNQNLSRFTGVRQFSFQIAVRRA